jgi:nitrite reductase/ring-hydroxylating ferredoxin subunit
MLNAGMMNFVARIRIALAEEIKEGETLKFTFTRNTKSQEGFVGRLHKKLFAYENTCRHIPITLDYGDNHFFDTKGEVLMCQTHGAVYEPDTGLCTRGPCAGSSLHPLKIIEEEGVLWFEEAPAS